MSGFGGKMPPWLITAAILSVTYLRAGRIAGAVITARSGRSAGKGPGMAATAFAVPTLERIEEVDRRLSGSLSDIDTFLTAVKRLAEEDPVKVDPHVYTRLLVFADEALDDSEMLASYASELRRKVLNLYVEHAAEAGIGGKKAEDDA